MNVDMLAKFNYSSHCYDLIALTFDTLIDRFPDYLIIY